MVSPFLFLAAISVALAQSRSMMPVQMQYEQPGLTSWSQFAKTVSPLASYRARVHVASSTTPSFHLSRLSGLKNVECVQGKMTLTLASLEKIQDWDQVPTILVVDHTANCFGNEMQFLLANEWTLDERKRQVVFSVTDAREANVDASLKVQVYPVDTSKGSSDGIDINQFGGDEVFPWWSDEDESGADEKPSVTPAEGEIGAMGFNRTIVYPYKFDQDLTGQYYIGTSGAFLDCQSCSVRGELDLVVEIRGSLRIGGTFKLSVYVTGSVAGAFKLSGGLKGHTSDGRMTLFYRDFFPYDIPGLFEMDPSFQIYAYASVSTDEALTFNTSIVAQAKNFQVQLIKVGHDSITGSSKVEQIQDLSITTEGPTVVSLDSGRASIDLKTRMAIVPELDITYKVMGQRRQKLDVGFLNAIDGDLTLTRSSTDCKLRGLLDARSILYSDIASNHKVLKESDVVKLKEGCLFV